MRHYLGNTKFLFSVDNFYRIKSLGRILPEFSLPSNPCVKVLNMMKPTGKAKLAYERGIRDRKARKRKEDNPYTLFGSANDMQASWWITGWQKQDKLSTGY